MSAKRNDQNEDGLDRLLRNWTVNEPLPPRFQDQVWHRIALRERPAVQPIGALLERISAWLSKPSVAVGYMLIAIVIGMGFGWTHGRAKDAQMAAAMESRYLEMVAPYANHP